MPTSNTFPACCGINIISGFPYDDELDVDPEYGPDDWSRRELENLPSTVKKAEGTYYPCHIIALTADQIQAAERIKNMGYIGVGTFRSRDGPYNVTVFIKGLKFFDPVPKPKKPVLAKECKSWKKYKGIRKPTCNGGVGCKTCWAIYKKSR